MAASDFSEEGAEAARQEVIRAMTAVIRDGEKLIGQLREARDRAEQAQATYGAAGDFQRTLAWMSWHLQPHDLAALVSRWSYQRGGTDALDTEELGDCPTCGESGCGGHDTESRAEPSRAEPSRAEPPVKVARSNPFRYTCTSSPG